VTVTSSARPPRDRRVITDRADLADAVVDAFLHGDAATRQHIVDTLGGYACPSTDTEDEGM
jgi:hypothetical protein